VFLGLTVEFSIGFKVSQRRVVKAFSFSPFFSKIVVHYNWAFFFLSFFNNRFNFFISIEHQYYFWGLFSSEALGLEAFFLLGALGDRLSRLVEEPALEPPPKATGVVRPPSGQSIWRWSSHPQEKKIQGFYGHWRWPNGLSWGVRTAPLAHGGGSATPKGQNSLKLPIGVAKPLQWAKTLHFFFSHGWFGHPRLVMAYFYSSSFF